MENCVTGKRMYLTQELAEDVLIETWVRNDFPVGNGPVAIYRCPDCLQFHLTSSGQMNVRLAEFIKQGKLKHHKEAQFWADKLKKK